MVFTPLCMGNHVGELYHLQGFLDKQCITNDLLMTLMHRHGIKVVNNKISRYIAKTIILLSPGCSLQLLTDYAQ